MEQKQMPAPEEIKEAFDEIAGDHDWAHTVIETAYRSAAAERDELRNELVSVSGAWEASKKDREFQYSGRIEAMVRAEKAESRLPETERLRDAIADELGTIRNDVSVMAAVTKLKTRLAEVEEERDDHRSNYAAAANARDSFRHVLESTESRLAEVESYGTKMEKFLTGEDKKILSEHARASAIIKKKDGLLNQLLGNSSVNEHQRMIINAALSLRLEDK